VNEIALLLDALAALQDLLGFDLILPELRGGGLGFYAGEFVFRVGCLKDSYADRQPGG
jgi:hypothetical protein